MNIDIGSKIKELRLAKKMNLKDLAKESDLSPGLISQIERNIVTPSIVSFWKIAQALEVSVGYFFDEEEKIEQSPIVKKGERRKISTSNHHSLYELLSPNLKGKIEFLYITINPDDQTSKDFVAHEGEECGLVIKGSLVVQMEDREYFLEEGDSICFDSSIPHKYVNRGSEICESVWAMTPPSF